MSENTSNHGHDCDEGWEPANQPATPAKDCPDNPPPDPNCPPTHVNEEPTWTQPESKCKPTCDCPTDPKPPEHCLQELINDQVEAIVGAQNAEDFKKTLEDLMKKSEAVRQEYTHEKYEKLLEEWSKQDRAIAELIRKLVCAVPCWKCVVDCHVCPLIGEIYAAEKSLFDDGKLIEKVNDLYDRQYWRRRDRDAKKRVFDRIQKVMTAWEKPADTIAAVLAKNKALIDKSNAVIGTEPGKAIFDVFLLLVPMHLAIAPPADKAKDTETKIHKKYTKLCCGCDVCPEDCCGPDVGPWSVRGRLIQPQPYLVDPNDYLNLFCCLVKEFYRPAKNDLNNADVKLATVDAEIERQKKLYEDGLKNLEKNAKAAIPSVPDCDDYKPKPQGQQPEHQGGHDQA